MNIMNTSYTPINCEFHDLLEMLATTRKVVRVVFRDAEDAEQVRIANIVDVFSREDAEHLATSSGDLIRLDWLIEVDGVRLADSRWLRTNAPSDQCGSAH